MSLIVFLVIKTLENEWDVVIKAEVSRVCITRQSSGYIWYLPVLIDKLTSSVRPGAME